MGLFAYAVMMVLVNPPLLNTFPRLIPNFMLLRGQPNNLSNHFKHFGLKSNILIVLHTSIPSKRIDKASSHRSKYLQVMAALFLSTGSYLIWSLRLSFKGFPRGIKWEFIRAKNVSSITHLSISNWQSTMG